MSSSQPNNSFLLLAEALPNWTAFIGSNVLDTVLYNSITIGTSGVSLITTNATGFSSLEGRYSVVLQAGIYPGYPGGRPNVSLSQTALVPATAQSLQFKAQPGFGSFRVSLNGNALLLFPLAVQSTYTEFGANIAPYAGSLAELVFTSVANTDGRLNDFYLDLIVFSTQPIPEPSAVALFGLGMAGISWRTRNCRRT